ncbi:hypothetical protein ACNKHN_20480 [Shigella flexneri]
MIALAAQRIPPPFLFHYMDGGADSEYTLRRNVEDFVVEVALRQLYSEKTRPMKPGNQRRLMRNCRCR